MSRKKLCVAFVLATSLIVVACSDDNLSSEATQAAPQPSTASTEVVESSAEQAADPSVEAGQIPRAVLTVQRGAVELLRVETMEFVASGPTEVLNVGDTVRTGLDGVAVLTFRNETQTTLFPDTELIINELAEDETSGALVVRVEQFFGVSFNNITFQSQDSRYEMATPNGIAAVRGTSFWTEVIEATKFVAFDVTENEVTISLLVGEAEGDSFLVERKTVEIEADGTIVEHDLDIICDPLCHPPGIEIEGLPIEGVEADASQSEDGTNTAPAATPGSIARTPEPTSEPTSTTNEPAPDRGGTSGEGTSNTGEPTPDQTNSGGVGKPNN